MFRWLVGGPHQMVAWVDAEYDGRIVAAKLPITSGSVRVDRSASIRRTLSISLPDRKHRWVPKGGADLFQPTVGTLLRPYRGVAIREPGTTTRLYNSADTWGEGTLTNLVVTPDGGLTLG
jgi:hypothetical protein